MDYKQKMKIDGALRTPVVEESLRTLEGDTYLKRKKINESVFDEADSIADNAKMISLIFSLVGVIWENMDKSNVDPKIVDTVHTVISKFRSVETWADYLFETEGLEVIDRLIDRQKDVARILSDGKAGKEYK